MAYQSELEKLQRRYEEKPSQWFAALAEEHRRAGDVPLAIEILNRGLEQRSNYVSGYIVLARCRLDRGEDDEAQQALERVLELDAENIIALKVLSEIAERGGDAAAARSWLERLLEVDPMNEEGRQLLERLGEAAEPEGAEGAVEAVGAVEAEEAVETEKDAPVAEEPLAPLEIMALEPGITDSDVVPAESPEPASETADEPAAEVPAENFGLVREEPESTPADEVELIEDILEPVEDVVAAASTDEAAGGAEEIALASDDLLVLERIPEGTAEVESSPTDESAIDITGAAVEHDTPLELKPDAGDGPLPEGIVGAEVDRPEPIELTGGPGMVVDNDQAAELVGSGGAAPDDLDSGDRSPLDTEPEFLEAAVPAGTEDTPASATEEPHAAPTQDAEPVVTETMAEVYVNQGLVDQALNVYRALLARRPADAELQNRIAELEVRAARAAAAPEGPRYRASETGGTSTRTFLAQILAAGAGEEALAEPTPLETAFSASEDASEIPGAPTQPAPDGASLESVFGEEPPSPPPPPPPPSSPLPGAEGGGTEGEVSYDEFFGGSGADQAPPPEKASSDEGDQPDDESGDFKDWLKGLKS